MLEKKLSNMEMVNSQKNDKNMGKHRLWMMVSRAMARKYRDCND